MLDHARKGQKWITEELYKIMDVFGFRAVMFVEWGFRPADVLLHAHRLRVARGEHHITDEHVTDAIEELMATRDRLPSNVPAPQPVG